jgi:hypothetical protein
MTESGDGKIKPAGNQEKEKPISQEVGRGRTRAANLESRFGIIEMTTKTTNGRGKFAPRVRPSFA